MKLWGKNRETVKITKVTVSRAVFIDVDHQEIEMNMRNEDGERLTLVMHPRLAAKIISELTSAYEAINPPLRRGSGPADFLGMDDFS